MKKFFKVWTVALAVLMVSCQNSDEIVTPENHAVEVSALAAGTSFDGQSYYYYNSPKANPFKIVVTGDGFTAADYNSGLFDQKVDALMDYFFSFDPYKSYKEYFEVFKLVAYSNVGGITNVSRDTKFGSYAQTSSYISHPASISPFSKTNAIYQFVMDNVPGIDQNNLDEVYVIVLCNANLDAGGCWRADYPEGHAFTILGMGPNYGAVNVHESGHGIGRLGDEYGKQGAISVPPGFPQPDPTPMPQQLVDLMISKRAGDIWNHYPNLHPYNDSATAPWAKYYTLIDYPEVGFYEGGNDWIKGCWHSTEFSIMNKGIEHASYGFNVICREAIVRRLMDVTGETFNFTTFLANDSNDVPNI